MDHLVVVALPDKLVERYPPLGLLEVVSLAAADDLLEQLVDKPDNQGPVVLLEGGQQHRDNVHLIKLRVLGNLLQQSRGDEVALLVPWHSFQGSRYRVQLNLSP